jgi:uncharacterized protein
MKKAVIVHGWGGNTQEAWIPWLKQKLEEKGYQVEIPAMPNTDEPQIKPWVNYLSMTAGKPDQQLSLIGHSIGCQTILRYLEAQPEGAKIGKVILVAAWLALTGLDKDEKLDSYEKSEKEIARPWLETPIDFTKIKSKANKFVAILSTDDPFAPYELSKNHFKELLDAEIITLENKGHINGESNVNELAEALKFFS